MCQMIWKKELRTVRAALNVAKRWEYHNEVPPMPAIDGYGKDKPFVTDEHFSVMLEHCDAARLPRDQHFTSKQFWLTLLSVAWMTGMRKSALIAIWWDDVDLDAGIIFSRYGDNKRKRDQRHRVGPTVKLLADMYRVRKPESCAFSRGTTQSKAWTAIWRAFKPRPGFSYHVVKTTSTRKLATCTASTVSGMRMQPTTSAACRIGNCKSKWGTPASRQHSTTSSTPKSTRPRRTTRMSRTR